MEYMHITDSDLDVRTRSVNPFSTMYWDADITTHSPPNQTVEHPLSHSQDDSMPPPKLPLQPRPNNAGNTKIVGAASGMKGPIMTVAKSKTAKAPPPKLSDEEISDFREAIEGSNLGKNDLLKALKQRYVWS